MNLGDVFAFFGILLALGIALPGLLVAWALLVPATVERARVRLHDTPGRCVWFGSAVLVAALIPIARLIGLRAGLLQFGGWLGLCVLLACASLGAAGIAALMGERLRAAGLAVSAPGALVRGAVALELAAICPLIGWFLVIPLTTVGALGAAGFALLHWAPRTVAAPPRVEATHAPYAP